MSHACTRAPIASTSVRVDPAVGVKPAATSLVLRMKARNGTADPSSIHVRMISKPVRSRGTFHTVRVRPLRQRYGIAPLSTRERSAAVGSTPTSVAKSSWYRSSSLIASA